LLAPKVARAVRRIHAGNSFHAFVVQADVIRVRAVRVFLAHRCWFRFAFPVFVANGILGAVAVHHTVRSKCAGIIDTNLAFWTVAGPLAFLRKGYATISVTTVCAAIGNDVAPITFRTICVRFTLISCSVDAKHFGITILSHWAVIVRSTVGNDFWRGGEITHVLGARGGQNAQGK